MNFYIVMQGKTYDEAKNKQVVWCSILDSSGQTPHSWERMKEVKKGDAIFHCVKGEIVAFSIAQEDCQQGIDPLTGSGQVGHLFKSIYEELIFPLNIKVHFDEVQPLLPTKYSPFQQNGDGNQGFLYPCNEMLAIKLLELISDANIYEENEEQLEFAMGLIAQKERNTLAPVLIETEAKAKVKIRKGQQKFHKQLAPLWDHHCALCGIDLPELLRASHSKPWKDSTDEERLNPYNGILLCSNHDAMYDKGYIAFDGTGKIHISPEIEKIDYVKYGIHDKMRVARVEENKSYFKWHKRNVFKG
ncbi:HNH endonuclease [Lysinibacillus sp. 2017]|uniref:HNH endonuclease n=1 Tax=unclassified Lysinibacillus TaxID=2636778 RepID=UPI000D528D47|nr:MULTISPECIES: HNH endonuclease [unclassified Lysinibacillus]AWE06173.1 HNH endonuclease [Lysinibacillus sp. 2017]TGN35174.1 HNH endonuclease [Lysinibacillus sp. S2017]